MIELLIRACEDAVEELKRGVDGIARSMQGKYEDLCVIDFDGITQDWYWGNELIIRLSCDLSASITLRKRDQTIPVDCIFTSDNKRLYEGEAMGCVSQLAEIIERELEVA